MKIIADYDNVTTRNANGDQVRRWITKSSVGVKQSKDGINVNRSGLIKYDIPHIALERGRKANQVGYGILYMKHMMVSFKSRWKFA